MNSLDDKLYENAVARIKTAFADEGYVQIPLVKMGTQYEQGKKPKLFMVNGKKVMTGQEWYDKFMEELPRPHKIRKFRSDTWWTIFEVIKAAEKASGIK